MGFLEAENLYQHHGPSHLNAITGTHLLQDHDHFTVNSCLLQPARAGHGPHLLDFSFYQMVPRTCPTKADGTDWQELSLMKQAVYKLTHDSEDERHAHPAFNTKQKGDIFNADQASMHAKDYSRLARAEFRIFKPSRATVRYLVYLAMMMA